MALTRWRKGLTGDRSPAQGSDQGASAPDVRSIPIDRITFSPYQARITVDSELLTQLAESIKAHGVLQPVLVRPLQDGRYELIAGERRLRAAKQAGLSAIPATVRDMDERESAVVGMIENLQREDLNCLEEAEGYERLISEFGLTQEQLAREIGKSQPTVANKLRLLKLGHEAKKGLRDGRLTETHGRALLRITDTAAQALLVDRVHSESMSVRETEQLVEDILSGGREARRGQLPANNIIVRPTPRRMKGVYKDIRIFLNSFRQAVAALNKAGIHAEISEQEGPDGVEVHVLIVGASLGKERKAAQGE